MTTKKDIEQFLRSFYFNDQRLDLIELEHVGGFTFKDNCINCVINVTPDNRNYIKQLASSVQASLQKLKNIDKVNLVLTAKKEYEEKNKITIPGVKNIILISSGKGGVGKSTIAFYLSLALAKQRIKVGLMDADIYGPSLPTFTKKNNKPEFVDGNMVPHEVAGVKMNSIGYLVEDGKALIWRGPMITKALYQLLHNTAWGELDFLIIDMPPGTGDIHLTLAEKYNIHGALIISTPQQLALADVARVIDMYEKLQIPLIGVVENMSYFTDDSGKKNHIFGDHQALQDFCKARKIRHLTSIPLDPHLSNINLNYEDISKIAALDNLKILTDMLY